MARILETRRMAGNWERYTGHFRLIDVPGGYIDLPGRGGKVTREGAARALAVFAAGGSNAEAEAAAHQGRPR